MPYALYTANVLLRALYAQFPQLSWTPGSVEWMNDRYCAVTREWVEQQFQPYWYNYLAARNDLTYRKRGNQCEHYAIRAALEAVQLFSLMDDPEIPAEAESIGVAWVKYFRSDGRGAHEVNLWFIGGAWLPWEPQPVGPRHFFDFAPGEILTVTNIRIP